MTDNKEFYESMFKSINPDTYLKISDLVDRLENNYVLVQWPDSQSFMDCDWFEEEASLADDKFGSAAYFIPMKRWLELQES